MECLASATGNMSISTRSKSSFVSAFDQFNLDYVCLLTKSLNLWLCYWQQIAVVVDEQLAGQGMCWVYILQSSSEFFFCCWNFKMSGI